MDVFGILFFFVSVKITVFRLAAYRAAVEEYRRSADPPAISCDSYSRIITVDKQAESVDYALMALLTCDGVVVTQDYGLAAMAIGKGARAINQNGLIFSETNIDRLLLERHIGKEIRRAGGRTKGPVKRSKEDDIRFEHAFLNYYQTQNQRRQQIHDQRSGRGPC